MDSLFSPVSIGKTLKHIIVRRLSEIDTLQSLQRQLEISPPNSRRNLDVQMPKNLKVEQIVHSYQEGGSTYLLLVSWDIDFLQILSFHQIYSSAIVWRKE